MEIHIWLLIGIVIIRLKQRATKETHKPESTHDPTDPTVGGLMEGTKKARCASDRLAIRNTSFRGKGTYGKICIRLKTTFHSITDPHPSYPHQPLQR